MPHKPEPEKNLSIKMKLALIVIMFVVINLIFYIGFDSSDESGKEEVGLDSKSQLDVEKNTETEQEIRDLITP